MIRIIGGRWRGKKLQSFHDGTTRPTRDRVRESLFNILEHFFAHNWSGKVVWDAFAGTGALGLEALSRGAEKVYFTEIHDMAFANLQKNVSTFPQEAIKLLKISFQKVLEEQKIQKPCHLIFLDPPYAFENKAKLLNAIEASSLLDCGGIICFEMPKGEELPLSKGYTLLDERLYGLTKLSLIQKEKT